MKFYLIKEASYKISIMEVLPEDEAAFLEAHKGEIIGELRTKAEALAQVIAMLEAL